MKRFLLFLFFFAAAAMAQTSETFGGNIVLGRPTDKSVTVNALFPADHDSVYVEYGEQPGQWISKTEPQSGVKANIPYQQALTGLLPDHRYYYRIRYRRTAGADYAASAEHHFQTQRPPGSAFRFSLIADSHLFTIRHCLPARYANTLANIHAEDPDFHIDLGDTFRTDTIVPPRGTLTYPQVVARGIAHRPFFNIVTADAPLFLVPGNHDSEYLYYTRPESNQDPNLPLWSTNARVSLYPNPVPDSFYTGDANVYPGVVNGGLRQSYYAWEWGDALFVTLDPYWNMPAQNATNWVPVHGDAQYRWLRDTLRKSKAKYKFVFAHHLLGQGRGGVEVAPQYEWGGVDPRRTQTFAQARPGWDKPIHQLFVETGVTIFFQGHDHLYARSELDGVTYVSVPMPAAGPPGASDYFPGNETAGNFDAYLKSFSLPSAGHVRVAVDPGEVLVEYVNSRLDGVDPGENGRVADRFRVGPNRKSVISAASLAWGPVAAGSLAKLRGADAAGTAQIVDSAGSTFDIEVAANGDFVVPGEAAAGPAAVTWEGGGTIDFEIDRIAPGLFAANAGLASGVASASAVLVKASGEEVSQPVYRCGAAAGSCVALPLDPGADGDKLLLTFRATGLRGVNSLEDVVVYVAGVRAEVLSVSPADGEPGIDLLRVRANRDLAVSGESGVVVAVEGRVANVPTVNWK